MSRPNPTNYPKQDGVGETVRLALQVIDKLLSKPIGDQMYAKEIAMLFRLISVQEHPPITMTGKFEQPNRMKKL